MDGRTVLVTGCSSGFGHGLVGALLADGWRVIATLRDAGARGQLFAPWRSGHPSRLTVLALDVADRRDRAALAEVVGDGRLDCLVNNAGYGLFGALEDLTEAQIRRQLEVNFFGAALLIRALLPALRRSRGRIINVSSMLGRGGLPLTSAYCASKFALEGLSESLWHELRPHGVQVAIVEPGGHRTRFSANAVWGEGSGQASSPYARQSASYRQVKARLSARQAGSADSVVRAVVRLASLDAMPLRVRVGMDSRILEALRRLLPERLGWRVQAALVDRLFLRRPEAANPAGAPSPSHATEPLPD